jgi:hypothetical protein
VTPGDVAAGTCQARCESGLDWLAPYPNDRYCAAGRADRLRNGVGFGNDHVRVPADDLASQIGKALAPSLAGIPLDGEILPLDIAQPA